MINRAVNGAISVGRSIAVWMRRHPRLRPVLGFLRKHWAETLAVACLVALVLGVNPPELGRVFSHVRWRYALLMLPVVAATYVARGTAWWFALRRIGVRIGLLRCLTVEFAGQVMVFLPLGDLARVAMLRATQNDEGSGPITGTIAFQELVFMMLLGLGVLPRVITNPGVAILVVLMVVAHVGVFTVLSWEPAYTRARRFAERVRVLRRFDKQLRELRPAFVELWSPRCVVPVFLMQAIAAALSFLLFFLALQAIGVTKLTFVMSTFILSLSYLLAGLSLIPGGLGAFEGLLTLLMVSNGVPAAAGAAAGLLYRGYNDVLIAVAGAPFALYIRRLAQRRSPGRQRKRKAQPSRARA